MPKIVGKSDEYVKRVTCWNCSSIVEYTKSECEYHKHSFDYTGSYEVAYGIKCPCCNTILTDKS